MVVCFLPVAWLRTNLGVYPYRMVCPSPPTGNGCYEGELMTSSVLTVPIFVVCAVVSALLAATFGERAQTRCIWIAP
ncbi:hypothetical protein D6T65_15880 [Arthrobacter frigidicola]|nr:hypothetical protein D6T65_15880 [Arthrobacter frigidicola]